VDQVIDVGGGATFRHSVDAVKMDGHITSIGILDGRSGSVQFPKLFFKHIHIDGIAVGSRDMQENMVAFYEKHQIHPILDEKGFAFDQLEVAFRHQESGQHFGKIILEW
ncbi:MAG: zinc-binding dehydrogenase, partial [Saprospiraceae bacterium]|nr:zinc-binding dehydrogenase [Saprospiraceae bacterium]